MLLELNHNIINNDDVKISLVIDDHGYDDYSIMTMIEVDSQKRLFNRVLVEDYKEGVIYAF